MQAITSTTINDWKISYNPYTDLFQIFNEKVFNTQNKDLGSKKKGCAVLVYEKSTRTPLMVEFRRAYEYLGDIDNMSKKAIIHNVIGYVESHG